MVRRFKIVLVTWMSRQPYRGSEFNGRGFAVVLMKRPCGISDLQEQLPAVHPEQYQPIAKQHGGAFQGRLEAGSEELEEVRTEVGAKRADEELFHEVSDAVNGNGIHADDHQGESPASALLHL